MCPMDYDQFDLEMEVTEEKFYELGLRLSLYELALAIQDEDEDIEAELNGDATQRFNQAMRGK